MEGGGEGGKELERAGERESEGARARERERSFPREADAACV